MQPKAVVTLLASIVALATRGAGAQTAADDPAATDASHPAREVVRATVDVERARRVVLLPPPPRLALTEAERSVGSAPEDGTPGLWQVMEGPRVAGGGDLNGDGTPDVLVANRNYSNDRPGRPNTVRGYSGRDGTLLFDVCGEAGFGVDLAFAGDIDRDGCSDVYVQHQVRILAYSGKTGEPLYSIEPEGPFRRMERIADLDGDGVPEIALCSLRERPNSLGRTLPIVVHSGRDGRELRSHAILLEPEEAATAAQLTDLGDIDADGLGDLGVLISRKGLRKLRVLSGRSGAEILVLADAGETLAAAGDVDRDGHADILLGTRDSDEVPLARDGVVLVSGRTGEPLAFFRWEPPDNGDSNECVVAGLGDTDGDGFVDFAIARPRWYQRVFNRTPANVYVVSGRDGSLLQNVLGSFEDDSMDAPGTSQAFGFTIAALGDVDGDGLADFAVGEDRWSNMGGEPDRAVVFRGRPADPSGR